MAQSKKKKFQLYEDEAEESNGEEEEESQQYKKKKNRKQKSILEDEDDDNQEDLQKLNEYVLDSFVCDGEGEDKEEEEEDLEEQKLGGGKKSKQKQKSKLKTNTKSDGNKENNYIQQLSQSLEQMDIENNGQTDGNQSKPSENAANLSSKKSTDLNANSSKKDSSNNSNNNKNNNKKSIDQVQLPSDEIGKTSNSANKAGKQSVKMEIEESKQQKEDDKVKKNDKKQLKKKQSKGNKGKSKKQNEKETDSGNENCENNPVEDDKQYLQKSKRSIEKIFSAQNSQELLQKQCEIIKVQDEHDLYSKYELPFFLQNQNIRDSQLRYISDVDYDKTTLYMPKEVYNQEPPIFKQYWDIKCVNYDKIVFFRYNRHFICLFRDAITINKICDIEIKLINNRICVNIMDSSYPLVLKTLVDHGEQCLITDEVDLDLDKGNIIKREITQIITTGTYIDEIQDDYQPRYLMSIIDDDTERNIGLAIVECSTHQFILDDFKDDKNYSYFSTILEKFKPIEIITVNGNLSAVAKEKIKLLRPKPKIVSKNHDFKDLKSLIQDLKREFMENNVKKEYISQSDAEQDQQKKNSQTNENNKNQNEDNASDHHDGKKKMHKETDEEFFKNRTLSFEYPQLLRELEELYIQHLESCKQKKLEQEKEKSTTNTSKPSKTEKQTATNSNANDVTKSKSKSKSKQTQEGSKNESEKKKEKQNQKGMEEQEQQQEEEGGEQKKSKQQQEKEPQEENQEEKEEEDPDVSYVYFMMLHALQFLLKYLRALRLSETIYRFGIFTLIDSSIEREMNLQITSAAMRNLEISQVDYKIYQTEKGSLLDYLTYTKTKFGQRLLRKWVLSPLKHESKIKNRLDAVEDLMGKMDLIEEFQKKVEHVADLERQVASQFNFLQNAKLKKNKFELMPRKKLKDFSVLLTQLKCLEEAIAVFSDVKDQFSSIRLKRLLSFQENENSNESKVSKNFFNMYLNPTNRQSSLTQNGLFPRICKAIEIMQDKIEEEDDLIVPKQGVDLKYDQIKENIQKTQVQIQKEFEFWKGKLKIDEINLHFSQTQNKCELEIPIEFKKQVPQEFILTSKCKECFRYQSPKLADFVYKLKQLEQDMCNQLLPFMESYFEEFYQNRSIWYQAISCVAEIDCLCSLAICSLQMREKCKPQFVKELGVFELKGMYHPCMEKALGTQMIQNDTVFDQNTNFLVITGPNMGGKSTLLRQTCLAAILAQIGCYVPANSFKLSIIDKIFCRIGSSDSLMEGKSTLYKELEETKEIADNATKSSLVIFDELGRGTGTFDGFSLAYGVMLYAANVIQCKTLFSTHYHQLLEEARLFPNIKKFIMKYKVNQDKNEIEFLYKFEEGEADKSFGVNVAKKAGLPQEIISSAELKSNEMNKEIQALLKLQKNNQKFNDVIKKLDSIESFLK